MSKRIEGYDFIRSVAILIVFLGHILAKQTNNGAVLLTASSLSPGLTMSLLGFISAVLLSSGAQNDGTFLIKRLTRIYVSLFLCLLPILCAHALLGKKVICQHMLLHLMGLSVFFDVFLVKNKATIGAGLWFISVILIMYLLVPLLQTLFRHPRGIAHLLALVLLCTGLNFVMYGTESTWNVVISFSVGVYVGVNDKIDRLINVRAGRSILGCLVLLGLATLATAHVLPYATRGLLFAFYPLAFVPLMFKAVSRLPRAVVAASGFFAALSYEFYILHFYFINEGFHDFFPIRAGLIAHIAISFAATFVLAYLIARVAARMRHVLVEYLVD